MSKILVVEDESSLQKAMVDVLKISGFEAIGANDGSEGLLMAKAEQPDLILLDVIMPKMNGFDVLKALKADDATKKIPVIMLTNLESSGDIEQALSLGAMTYLVKTNYELDDIIKRVKDSLAKAQSQ